MNRRGFFSILAGAAAALTLDPEKLLWVPGEKKIFLPSHYEYSSMMAEIDRITLERFRPAFLQWWAGLDSPLMKRLREREMCTPNE
jgi:hypothetical protein